MSRVHIQYVIQIIMDLSIGLKTEIPITRLLIQNPIFAYQLKFVYVKFKLIKPNNRMAVLCTLSGSEMLKVGKSVLLLLNSWKDILH